MSDKIKVSIVGVTGFTGSELLRVLLQHPGIEISYLISRQYEDAKLAEVYPRLSHRPDLRVTNTPLDTAAGESDVIFLCLPHMVSQDVAPDILGKCRVIDLSADFRLQREADFQTYYGEAHKRPDLLDGSFVYGLPETNRDAIRNAQAVANPGCFALLAQLMLFPFKGALDHAHFTAISGTSGGGRKSRDPVEHPVCAQNIRSYLINQHRHIPEVTQALDIAPDTLDFLPTVGPFLRGIHATAFVKSGRTPEQAAGFYNGEPFLRLRGEVNLTHVVSTNFCDLSYQPGHGAAGESGNVIVQGAIDNLLKGASGTAVQNMNLMFGLDEEAGLSFDSPIYP